MPQPDELKPCPFCPTGKGTITKWVTGSALDEFAPYSATCDTCGCELDDFDTEQQARDAWNTRSTPDLSRILKLAAFAWASRDEAQADWAPYANLTSEDHQLLEAILKEQG